MGGDKFSGCFDSSSGRRGSFGLAQHDKLLTVSLTQLIVVIREFSASPRLRGGMSFSNCPRIWSESANRHHFSLDFSEHSAYTCDLKGEVPVQAPAGWRVRLKSQSHPGRDLTPAPPE